MLIAQLRNEMQLVSEQLETVKEQHAVLQNENNRIKKLMGAASKEITDTKDKLSARNIDLESSQEANENLQRQMDLLQEQLNNATSALAQKVEFLSALSLLRF